MAFTFRPAIREQAPLLLGVSGPSGSGKTASALKLARGLLGGKDDGIYVIDTEAGRAKHYACAGDEEPGPFRFRFQHCDFAAPFSPDRYLEAIEAAIKTGARVVVIDSMSHVHESEGGMLEAHEAELARLAGDDYKARERMKFAAWIRPKKANNKLVTAILQMRCHLIFGFRAKDKLAMVKNKDGKSEMVAVGWTPICSDRFEYEMSTLLMLPPNARGVPDLGAPATKINEHHRAFFRDGEPISEHHGEQLAAWARGGKTPATAPAPAAKPAEKPAAKTKDVDEAVLRDSLMTEIKAEADKRKMRAPRRAALWQEYVGAGGPDTADPSALRDLLDAIKKLAVA